MTNLVKLGVIITGIGTLGGGVALTHSLLNKEVVASKTISEKLTEEGFELHNDDTMWDNVLKAHNKLSKDDNVFQFSNESERTRAWLKEKCAGLLTKSNIDVSSYKKVKQWCVKEDTINDILSRGKFKVLNTNNVDDNDNWVVKVEKLKKDEQAKKSLSISVTSNEDNNAIIVKLKGVCKGFKVSTIKTTEKGFNDTFEKARNWCSIKG